MKRALRGVGLAVTVLLVAVSSRVVWASPCGDTGNTFWHVITPSTSTNTRNLAIDGDGLHLFWSLGSDLSARNASTGVELWRRPFASFTLGRPVVFERSDRTIVVVAGTNGFVYAMDADGTDGPYGTVVWSRSTKRAGCSNDAISAAPVVQVRSLSNATFQAAVNTDLVLVGTKFGCATTTANKVLALDSGSGNVRWTFNATAAYQVDAVNGMALDYARNLLYAATDKSDPTRSQNTLWSLRTTTGAKVWGKDLGSIRAEPLVSHGYLFVATLDGTLYKIDPDTGTIIWSLPVAQSGSQVVLDMASHPGLQYLFVTDTSGRLHAILDNGTSASPIWSTNVGGRNVISTPAVYENKLYVGTETNFGFNQIELTTGEWQLLIDPTFGDMTSAASSPGDQSLGGGPPITELIVAPLPNRLLMAAGGDLRLLCIPLQYSRPGSCGPDSDGDGAPNCNDGCPNDPDKVAPGQCGCGIADTDTDEDGTADCLEDFPVSIAIDARALTVPTFEIEGVTGPLSTVSIQTVPLNAGDYVVTEGSVGGNQFAFTIDGDGLVQYAPALESFLSGAGTTTLVVDGFATSLDAHALSASTFFLMGMTGSLSTAGVASVRVIPGTYQFVDATNNPVVFSVDGSGHLQYAPELEAFLSGAGTTSLVVDGFPLDVDARSLSVASFYLAGLPAVSTQSVASFTVLPGNYEFVEATGLGNPFAFSVDGSGEVQYAPALAAFLSGAGTTILVVDGYTLSVDARPLSASSFFISGFPTVGTQSVGTFTVIPGAYQFVDGTGLGNSTVFSVDNSGLVQYDPALESFLGGAGTATLVVDGFSVSVDARSLSVPTSFLSGIPPVSTQTVATFSLIPGSYQFYDGTGLGNSFVFTVDDGGLVQYAPALENFLGGAGTATLVLDGFSVSVDARSLSVPVFYLAGIPSTGTQTVATFTLLPGNYQFVENTGLGNSFVFTVDDGLVQYAPTLESFLGGAGTATLVVDGFSVSVDARTLSVPLFYLSGIPSTGTQTVATFTLIPGNFQFVDGTGLGCSFIFTVDGSGLVQYVPGFEGFLTGAGTTSLVVDGFTVSVDARSLGTPIFFLSGVPSVSTQTVASFTLIPGNFEFVDGTGLGNRFVFTVDGGGLVQYAPALEGFVGGAGTTALVVDGYSVTIDAGALTTDMFYLVGGTPPLLTGNAAGFTGVPGGYHFIAHGGQSFVFSIDGAGLVQYAPAQESFLGGAGTVDLVVDGFPVTVDARALGLLSTGYFLAGTTPPQSSSAVASFRVIPGTYELWDLPGAFTTLRVDDDGLLRDLPGVFDGLPVSGDGTPRLRLGAPGPFSVTEVSPPSDALTVPTSSSITVTFAEAVDPATVTTGSIQLLAQGGVPVPVTRAVSGLDVTLDPIDPLDFDTLYSISVTDDVLDFTGQPCAPFASLFLTEASPADFSLSQDSTTGSGPTQSLVGSATAGAGDLNQDGTPDMMVGASGYQPGTGFGVVVEAGAVLVFFGSPVKADRESADLIFTGESAHDRAGVSVAGGFDYNGDGFTDILIGAEQVNRTVANDPTAGCNAGAPCGPGRAYVIFFDPTDTVHYPNLGNPSVPDIVSLAQVGAPGGIPGIVFTGAALGDQLGFAVAGGGKVNAGPLQDIVLGAPGFDVVPAFSLTTQVDAGAAYVVFDDPDICDQAALCDGAPQTRCIVCVSRLANGQPSEVQGVVYTGEAAGDRLGFAVAFPGDVMGTFTDLRPVIGANGDDIALAAPEADPSPAGGGPAVNDAGIVYVVQSGTLTTAAVDAAQIGATLPSFVAGTVLPGEQQGERLGYAVSGGGDNIADGHQDLLIGAPFYDAGAQIDAGRVVQVSARLASGTVSLDRIGSTEVDGIAGTRWIGTTGNAPSNPGDHLGSAVAALGDVTGDGLDDIAMGAPYADPEAALHAGVIVQDAGATYMATGSAMATPGRGIVDVDRVGFSLQGAARAGTQSGETSGASVSAAGDVDADGVDDFIVGAPKSSTSGTGSGLAYIVLDSGSRAPGSCGPEGCTVSDLETGTQIAVPPASLAGPEILEVTALTSVPSLPAPPPSGTSLLAAARFAPEGLTLSSPLPTVSLATVSAWGAQIGQGETFDLYTIASSLGGPVWTPAGIVGTVHPNAQYGLPGLAVEADISVLRTYAVFIPDLDGDGTRDTLDPDIDGDGVPNGTDCAPLDPANAPPVEVTSEAFAPNKQTLSWNATPTADRYNVLRGRLDGLPVGSGGGDELCLGEVTTTTTVDAAVPLSGSGYWYLVRASNACGAGSYGSATSGPRVSTTCP